MSITFKAYLERKNYHPKVLESYLYYQRAFIKWLEEESLTVENCQYVDLLSYVKKLKEKERSNYNLNNYIRGIKYYYEYLQSIEETKHNPARKLYIKGNIQQLPSDLLSKKEMNHIYVDYPNETLAQKRNKVMLGLVIYQAMRQDELAQLRAEDIDLHKGTIYIKKTGRGARRTLKLEAHQILPLQEYIKETLPKLQKAALVSTDKLITSLGKNTNLKELVGSFMKELRKKHPRFKNLLHIRSSVISHWINEKNIIEVQYMAGHNSITSTEVYKHVNMKDLKKALDMYHPLN